MTGIYLNNNPGLTLYPDIWNPYIYINLGNEAEETKKTGLFIVINSDQTYYLWFIIDISSARDSIQEDLQKLKELLAENKLKKGMK